TIGLCSAKEKAESKNSYHKNESARIAFLGVPMHNLRSNYFTNDLLAEKMDAPEDAIDEVFSKNFFTLLEKACTRTNKMEAVYCCCEDAQSILKTVDFIEEGDGIKSDFSTVPAESIDALLEKTMADYIVLIDQYYVKKEGYPYNNISHIISYSVYDENRTIVSQGRHHFTSLDMDELSRYNKQFSKAAHKLIAKIGS
ncbi:MAG: hypothetical protein LIP01_00590, partial [Tannerellaceae bacterium]|nr:hypothetical protein [Tannerellaceae bacterium]